MKQTFEQTLMGDAATEILGMHLGQVLKPGCVVYLSGPLGAGKSTLVRSILHEMGVKGPIKSPSYSLVESYEFSRYSIYHFDFYRFFDENEWEDCGFRDCFSENTLCLVEWAEKAVAKLPIADLEISLNYLANSSEKQPHEGRQVRVEAKTKLGTLLLGDLKETLKNE